MIYGERVRLAREARGLTQSELASRIGISQSAIAQIESGLIQPSSGNLDAIAFATRFPPSFFREVLQTDLPLGSLSLYRARTSIRSRDLAKAHALAVLVWDSAKEMLQHLEPILVRLPQMPGTDPTTAAQVTRSELGLPPEAPIERIILPVERAGVIVLALPANIEGLDAFSTWAGSESRQPMIFTSREAAGDRLRFNVAHELGHLVMHSPPRGSVQQLEVEANQFAAEFLVPAEAIRRDIVSPVTLTSLATLKPKWRVSIAMLIRRARDVGRLSDRQYRYLMQQLSARGWRTQEPENLAIPAEKPRALKKMAEVLFGESAGYEQLASRLHLRSSDVREILDAHADISDLSSTPELTQAAKRIVELSSMNAQLERDEEPSDKD